MRKHNGPKDAVKTVLVIGGRGFIGRHIVKYLRRTDANIIVGTRNRSATTSNGLKFKNIRMHKLVSPASWYELLEKVDIVINSVGILRQRHNESYQQVHFHAVDALARACHAKGIRLVHVSILGVDAPSSSRFVLSKRVGEAAVKRSGADWYIVRPSLVDGEGGFGARWFRRVAAWPVHFTPSNANGGFAPVDADDLGEAISKIALSNNKTSGDEDRIYEFAGEKVVTVSEYLSLLNPVSRQPPVVFIPGLVTRLISHLCDLLHITPLSYGHYELLQYPNVPQENKLSSVLGRRPKRIGVRSNSHVVEEHANEY